MVTADIKGRMPTLLGEMADVYASKPKTGAEFPLGRPNSSCSTRPVRQQIRQPLNLRKKQPRRAT